MQWPCWNRRWRSIPAMPRPTLRWLGVTTISFPVVACTKKNREAAIRHAHAATAHGGDDATALAIAGLVVALDAHDSATAFRLFDQALALSSSNIFALSCGALSLAWSGYPELAVERAQRALRLSPFDPMNFMPNCAMAIAHFHGGRYEAAREAARQAVAANPRFSVCHAHLAAALVRLGQCAAAADAARQVLALNPGFTVSGFRTAHRPAPEVFERYAQAWREAGLPGVIAGASATYDQSELKC